MLIPVLLTALAAGLSAQDPVGTGSAQKPAATADALRNEGVAAFEKKNHVKAVELLQEATKADPKVRDGFLYLGRALEAQWKWEEALAAFSRQIEITPRHETAYSWRSHVLANLGRQSEAEADLRTQVELRPFTAYPYERLAKRLADTGRHSEAVDLFVKAAILEPKVAARWVDLAEAQAKADLRDGARLSLLESETLQPAEDLRFRAARAYASIDDFAAAGRLAEDLISPISAGLAKLSKDDFATTTNVMRVLRLAKVWTFVGKAALAERNQPKSERYLEAAWRLAFLPEAAWALGDLREKQKRLADAVEYWSMAAAIPYSAKSLPKDFRKRIDDASAALPDVPRPAPTRRLGFEAYEVTTEAAFPVGARQTQAAKRLLELRTMRWPAASSANFRGPVLVLFDASGKFEDLYGFTSIPAGAFERQVDQLGPLRVDIPRPDKTPYKAVLSGLLVCETASGCKLIRDVGGMGGFDEGTMEGIAPKSVGSLQLLKIDPPEGSVLKKGDAVKVTATLAYAMPLDGATALLIASDPTNRRLQVSGMVSAKVKGKSGEITLTTTFTVPPEARAFSLTMTVIPPGSPGPAVVTDYKLR